MKTIFMNGCARAVLIASALGLSAAARAEVILNQDMLIGPVIGSVEKSYDLNGYTLNIRNSDTQKYAVYAADFSFSGGGTLSITSVPNPPEGEGRGIYGTGMIDVDTLQIDLTAAPTPKGVIYVPDANDASSGTTKILDIEAKTVILKGNGGIVTNAGGILRLNADTLLIEAGAEGIKTAENAMATIHVKNLVVQSGLKGTLATGETANAFESPYNSGNTTITVTEKAEIKGDIVVGSDGKTGDKLSLDISGPDSVIEGAIKTVGGATGTDIQLNNGATWTATGDSNVTLLTLNNAAVDLNGQNIDVNELKGDGRILVDVTSNNMGSFNAAQADSAKVTVDMGSADFVTNENAQKALASVQANGAQKTGYASEGLVKGEIIFNANGTVASEQSNSIMQDTLTLVSGTALSLNRIVMNDVRKRLGDIRAIHMPSGAWVRYDGAKMSGKGGFKNKFHTFQVGLDNAATGSPFRLGVTSSYTFSDADYRRGKADMKAFSFAGYGLYTFQNGTFMDIIGRLAGANTDVTVDDNLNGKVDNMAVSLSAEAGQQINVSDNFFVEPQAELTYTYIDSGDLTLNGSNTVSYDYDAVNSLIGRVGGVFGIQRPNDSGKNFYVRISALHEFFGDTAVSGTTRGTRGTLKKDGKDTWVEFAFGGNFTLTENAYVWADLERTAGAKLNEDYRINIGLRYNF